MELDREVTYNDDPATTVDTDYVGDLQIGDVYFRWTVEQGIDHGPLTQRLTKSPPSQISKVVVERSDPYLLQEIGVAPAGSNGQTVEVITIAEAGAQPGDLVRWTDNSVGVDNRFAQLRGRSPGQCAMAGRLCLQRHS